jgi:DNA-binding response OmpR family regulator
VSGPAREAASSRVLLVIDREPTRLMLLADRLRADGFEVHAAATRDHIVEALDEHPPDVAILGPSVTGSDGDEIAGQIRSRSAAPLLQIVDPARERARRDARGRVVVDRSITAPFEHDQLLARIDELLRLAGAAGGGAAEVPPLVLDLDASLARVGDRTTRLSPLETRLLVALSTEPGGWVATSRLLAEVWPGDRDPDSTSLWILVWRLRQKLELDPRRPTLLVSRPGLGYRLVTGGRAS